MKPETLKPFLTLLFLLLAVLPARAQQLAVLFVDDSDDTFGNGELFAAALDSVGYPVTYFDAVDSAASPTDLYMSFFDLVIWYSSANGVGLQFWNGLDEDNPALKAYLENGGRLWVVGLDFLFDRYGAAPDTFAAGDFVYDYLGLQSYDLQSYGDDGNLGVPLAYPDTAQQVIGGLNTLTWLFSTLWWVDGVSLRPEAVPVYRMGGAGYVFADSICGVWYENGTSQVLSYFFDLAVVSDFEMLKAAVSPVMGRFSSIVSGVKKSNFAARDFRISPNPASEAVSLHFSLKKNARVSADLWDIQGRRILELLPGQTLPAGTQQLSASLPANLPQGAYLLRLEVDGLVQAQPLILAR